MAKNLHKAVILGSIWGAIEATLGCFLHIFTVGIGWALWFPIAFFFINKAYQWTKSYPCVMATAAVASSIKLINLFFPVRVDMVINPAVSIIFEALSVVLVYHYVVNGERGKPHIFDILLIGFTWRTLYLGYVFLLPEHLLAISPAATALSFTKFMFFENVANSTLIFAGFLLAKKLKNLDTDRLFAWIDGVTTQKRLLKPGLSFLAFFLAVIIKLITI